MKEIRFDLSYGDERIKSLAELKENYNIDMLLETLKNGLLFRWLLAQGEIELSEKFARIDKNDYRKATSELLKFLFDKEASHIEEASAELFAIREKETKRFENLKMFAVAEKEIIRQYHEGYENILKLLKENSQNYAILKAQMIVLSTKYRKLFELNKDALYETFKKDYPLVLLAFMANANLREIIGNDSEILYENMCECMGINTNLEMIREKIVNPKKHPAILIENDKQLSGFK